MAGADTCAVTSTTSPAAAIRICSTSSSRGTSDEVRQFVADARGAQPGNTATCPLNGSELNGCRVTRRRPASARIAARRRSRRAPTCSTASTWDTAMPIHMAVGVRYEETDVTSSALVPDRDWHQLDRQQRVPGAVRRAGFHDSRRASYDYVLPSVDFSFDVRDNLKVRASVWREHRASGLGRYPGRTDHQRSRAYRRWHGFAG